MYCHSYSYVVAMIVKLENFDTRHTSWDRGCGQNGSNSSIKGGKSA